MLGVMEALLLLCCCVVVVVCPDLGHLAAAPLIRLLVEAAGIAILAAGVVVTWVHKLRPRLLRLLHSLHRLSGSHRHHHHGGLLAPHGRGLRPAVAGVGGEVAGGAGGAAMLMVGAADRLIGPRQHETEGKNSLC